MQTNLVNVVKFSAIALSLTLAAGCASTSELNKVRTTADQALAAANSAQQTANAADSKASQALQAAQDSQACCNATNEKIDRMFKKSMYK